MPVGTLYIIAAPSGAGKTSLVQQLVATTPGVVASISHTTRPPRPGEQHGQHYYFTPLADFEAMIAAGAFLEQAQVFGNRYGTSKAQVEKLIAAGHDVLLEIDWQGARQIRANAPACRTVFIMPPSATELERRLRTRATDSDDVIRRRLSQALDDMGHWAEFDYLVVNEELGAAVDGLVAILAGQGAALATAAPATAARARAILAS